MAKDNLDYTTKIHHHENDEILITLQDYQDEPTITLEIDDGSKSRICMTLSEMKNAVKVFEDYNKARAILINEGE
jgi:hypothetical protein